MASSSILIIGLDGLGVETAKNIILAGVKSVTIYDELPTKWADLSSQFYLSETDIGKPRSIASAPKLAELNPYVQVHVHRGELSHDFLSSFQVIALIDQSLSLQYSLSEFCHNSDIYFLIGDARGVYGRIFCDFGPNFVVQDSNGEQAANSIVASISRSNPALVTVLEETRHNLDNGDVIVLTDVVGMEELNGSEFLVTVKDMFSFEINCDTTQYGLYKNGGYVNQIKQNTVIGFLPFEKSIESPTFVSDEMKIHNAPLWHATWRAFYKFQENFQRLPNPGSEEDAQQLLEIVRQDFSSNPTKLEGSFQLEMSAISDFQTEIKRFAYCIAGSVSPVCALVGGVLGQEILKACSGKFMPIRQWYYFDAVESLPAEPLTEEAVSPVGCRYDGQIMVFGKSIQEQLSRSNAFLVGAGAIGCEMLKNLALMGFATTSGTVHVTDMDQIERSNLSRQFLFRNQNIGQLKSSTAARAVVSMNSSFRTVAYESKVAPETEDFFNDDFFEQLDIVCAALDNVEARLYLDQRCMFYHKPMLESGTLGAKGHTQIVVPGLTENYGASRDPPEKSIPLCTLKSFPNQIEHTLQWAREWFEEIFKQTPADVNNYIDNPDFLSSLESQQNTKLETLQRIHAALNVEKPNDFHDCLVWARIKFEELFVNRIKQLLYTLPLDKVSSTGALFWSGAKKAPSIVEFSPLDPLHVEFIVAIGSLRAVTYEIPVPSEIDHSSVKAVVESALLPMFSPTADAKIATTEEEAKQESVVDTIVDIDDRCFQLLSTLPPPLVATRLHPIEFDKDVDSHLRVVAACSNLRARNYKIPEADLHKSRGIVGKIMPAIATTTALVTGLICIEIYKLLQQKPVESFKNTFSNLAVPLFASMEPQPPKLVSTKIRGVEWKWSQWDRIEISQPTMTLNELITHVRENFGAELTMLSSGVTILYSTFSNKKKNEERKRLTLKSIVETVVKKVIPSTQKYLIFEMILNDVESDEELEIPYLRFRLH